MADGLPVQWKQKKLSFGLYGLDDQGKVSLATARKKRGEAKGLIAKGIDPGVAKKEEQQEKAATRTFASWADEWLAAHPTESLNIPALEVAERWFCRLRPDASGTPPQQGALQMRYLHRQ